MDVQHRQEMNDHQINCDEWLNAMRQDVIDYTQMQQIIIEESMETLKPDNRELSQYGHLAQKTGLKVDFLLYHVIF